MAKIAGIIPPVVNPLKSDETLDESAFAAHVAHLLEAGVHGVFVLGTAGEQAALLNTERQKVIRRAVSEVAGRVPVLVGVMAAGTKQAVLNAQEAEALGADVVVATLPYYYPTPGDVQVIEHFTTIAESIRLPLMLYNIPQAVKSGISLNAARSLSEIPNIIGVKDSQESWQHVQQMLVAFDGRENFRVLVGSEANVCVALLFGASGAVLGISNVIPRCCVQLYDAARRGDTRAAFERQKQLMDAQRIYNHGFWLSCQKAAVSLLGFGELHLTKPLPTVSPEGLAGIREILRTHGVLKG